MPENRKKYFPKVTSFKGTGPFSRLSFRGKVYTTVVIFLCGFIIQGFLIFRLYGELKQELIAVHNSNDQIMASIKSLQETSPSLLNRCQSSLLAGTGIEATDIITRINTDLKNLKVYLPNDPDLKSLAAKYQLLGGQIKEYRNTGLTKEQYLEVKKLYTNYADILLKLDTTQSEYIANNQFKPMYDQIWLLVMAFLLLILIITLSSWLLISAVKSITKPAHLMTERFSNARLQVFNINLPIASAEGLGKAGLLFTDSLAQLNSMFLNSKTSIKIFNALCLELVMEIRKTELFAIQLQKVAEEITANVDEQNQFIERANEEIAFLANNSGTLHKIPQKLVLMTEDLKNQLSLIQIQTKEILAKPIEYQDETLQITDLADNLVTTSARVGEIVLVLNDVAERTELLAFNTAIQAARAGEKGLGFSVVAKEIAKLVEHSNKASARLNELLNKTQEKNHLILDLIATRPTRVLEEETVYQQVMNVCLNMFDTADTCLDDLSHLSKVMEAIFIKGNELSREANLITSIANNEAAVGSSFEVDILDYQLNVKETNRVAFKIGEMSDELNSLAETGSSEDVLPF